jgi:hypothetical protein
VEVCQTVDHDYQVDVPLENRCTLVQMDRKTEAGEMRLPDGQKN